MKVDEPAFLDRPAARWLAAVVILLCGGLLAFLHRDDLQGRHRSDGVADTNAAGAADGTGGSGVASTDPAAPCIEQRFAEIDGMIDEGMVDSGQAALFKQRALAMCRATTDNASGKDMPLPVE
ncbi:MAG: hypothetical protein ACR2QJ_00945 [Geminicoccaceae bacterium]